MKRLVTAIALMLTATVVFSQSKTLFWNLSVKPKMDKHLEYEKKVLPFIKTHYATLKYRAWEVITGDNTGNFAFVIGPTTYKEQDTPIVSPKGEAMVKADGQALDALCESSKVMYSNRQEDLSNMKADRKLKFIAVTSYIIKPGTWGDIHDHLLKIKEARQKGGTKMDIDVHRPSNSGPGNAFTIVRFCETMEELSLQENLNEMYDKVYGDNSFVKASDNFFSMVMSAQTELRVLRADLSQL